MKKCDGLDLPSIGKLRRIPLAPQGQGETWPYQIYDRRNHPPLLGSSCDAGELTNSQRTSFVNRQFKKGETSPHYRLRDVFGRVRLRAIRSVSSG